MKKHRVVVLVLVIINFLSLAGVVSYKKRYEEADMKRVHQVVALQGENEKWLISGASFSVADSKQYLDGGCIQYIGEKAVDLRFLNVEFILTQENKTLYNSSISSNRNMIFNKDEKINLGGIGELLESPREYPFQLNAGIIVRIEYKDEKDEHMVESFELETLPVNLKYFND